MAYVRCIEYACLTIYYVFWGQNNGQQQDELAMHKPRQYIQCKMKIPKAEIAKICSDYVWHHFIPGSVHAWISVGVGVSVFACVHDE